MDTVDSKCPKCGGVVKVPTQVFWHRSEFWSPLANCLGCGRGFQWYDGVKEKIHSEYFDQKTSNTRGWYCDRLLQAPEPKVIE